MIEKVVGETGFEPATLCSQSRCATRLRYSPTREPIFRAPPDCLGAARLHAGVVGPAGFEPAT